ncbi:MAG: molybdopterin-guanine dinucleotide biosynthesis protein MobB [Anaerolineales bacterium]|nr:molybdopterin-guanine dinucleotide biosynthesis protein MobB [Anaerolineales bacterium]
MRTVGIVGYKNSGKTTLARALAQELVKRGRRVAAVKHSSEGIDFLGKDTARLGEFADRVGFISPLESGVFWKKPLSLENMAPYLEADVLLVEGFKAEKTFPKIVCLRGEPDDRDLFDGLAICAVGPAHEGHEHVPHLSLDEIGGIADLVEEKAFKLPNLDCGSCGFETCYELAREIVKGNRSVEDCTSLQPITEVRIDGELMPMNPFISSIVRNTILGTGLFSSKRPCNLWLSMVG